MKKYYLLLLLCLSLTVNANDDDIKFINSIHNFEKGSVILNRTSNSKTAKIILCSLKNLTKENYNFCISLKDKEINKFDFSSNFFNFLNIKNTKYKKEDVNSMLF